MMLAVAAYAIIQTSFQAHRGCWICKGTGALVNTTDLYNELEALRTRYEAIRGHL